jgi:hypothetical protein
MYLLTPEILILVFQSCESLTQACALASTCRRLYQVWESCRPGLGVALARYEVVDYDNALLAVSHLLTDILDAGGNNIRYARFVGS